LQYGRAVLACICLLGCGYAAAAFQPEIYHVVREHVLPPETLVGAATNLGCMGGALGMFISLGLAPPAFLRSEAGRWWVNAVGRAGGIVLFRIEMLGLSAFLLFVTAVVVGEAFLER
jgi:hypothetical protein